MASPRPLRRGGLRPRLGPLAGVLLLGAAAGPGAPPGGARAPDYHVAPAVGASAPLWAVEEAAWEPAERITWGPEAYATTFRALWSAAGLLVRFDARDPDPWHTLERRDDRLWQEEVVEIFLEPAGADGNYVEVEISPGNVVCDVWVDWPHQAFDASWNLEGLENRVLTRRDGGGHTTGWSAVALLPWSGLRRGSGRPPTVPPRAGDRWRFNVFRIERPGGKVHPEAGALFLAWSPTGQRSFHVPDAFRGMVFLAPSASSGPP